MAKTNTVQIKLVSSADTGFFYVTKKNPRTKTEKLELKKYDPVARKHVVFKEAQDQITRRAAERRPGLHQESGRERDYRRHRCSRATTLLRPPFFAS